MAEPNVTGFLPILNGPMAVRPCGSRESGRACEGTFFPSPVDLKICARSQLVAAQRLSLTQKALLTRVFAVLGFLATFLAITAGSAHAQFRCNISVASVSSSNLCPVGTAIGPISFGVGCGSCYPPQTGLTAVSLVVDGASVDCASPSGTVPWDTFYCPLGGSGITLTGGFHHAVANCTIFQSGKPNITVQGTADFATDDAPPTVAVKSPANGAIFPGGAGITVSGTMTDDTSIISSYLFAGSGSEFYQQSISNPGSSWSFSFSAPSGTYLQIPAGAEARDCASNFGRGEVSIIIDGTPPQISFVTSLSVSTSGTLGEISGTISEETAVQAFSLQIFDGYSGEYWDGSGFNSASPVAISLPLNSTGTVPWTYAALESQTVQFASTITVTAQAVDAAGNVGYATSTVFVVPVPSGPVQLFIATPKEAENGTPQITFFPPTLNLSYGKQATSCANLAPPELNIPEILNRITIVSPNPALKVSQGPGLCAGITVQVASDPGLCPRSSPQTGVVPVAVQAMWDFMQILPNTQTVNILLPTSETAQFTNRDLCIPLGCFRDHYDLFFMGPTGIDLSGLTVTEKLKRFKLGDLDYCTKKLPEMPSDMIIQSGNIFKLTNGDFLGETSRRFPGIPCGSRLEQNVFVGACFLQANCLTILADPLGNDQTKRDEGKRCVQ